MKLLMEQWRVYQEQVKEDDKFNHLLTEILNSKEEKQIDALISEWISEQEQILNEIDFKGAIAKGMEFISRKVNEVLLRVYFKAVDIVTAIFKAGVKFMSPAIKVLSFMGNRISAIGQKHPVLARVGTVALITVCMLCASAIANTAMASGAEGNPELDKYVDMLQGIMTDKITDLGQYGAQDLLKDSDPEIKAKLADAINHLEGMKGSLNSLADLKKVDGEIGKTIKTTSDWMVDLYQNPPEGMDRDSVKTALENWQRVGEQIEQVHYEYSEYTSGGTTRSSEKFKSN